MNVQHGGMILTKETEVFRGNPIPVLISPLQILQRLAKGWNWTAVTNCLSHSTALNELLTQQNTIHDGHVTSSDKKPSLWLSFQRWLQVQIKHLKCYHALPHHCTGTPRTGTGPWTLDVSLASAMNITVLFSRHFCPSICHEFILESGKIVSFILQPQHYMAVSGQLHALAA
jgi:hypothetical protein